MKSEWVSRQCRQLGHIGFLSTLVVIGGATPVLAESFAERLHRWEKKLCQPSPHDTRCRARTQPAHKPANAQTKTKDAPVIVGQPPAAMTGQKANPNGSQSQQGVVVVAPETPSRIEHKPLVNAPSTSQMQSYQQRNYPLPPGVVLPATKPISKPLPFKQAQKQQAAPEAKPVAEKEVVSKPPPARKKLTDRVAPSDVLAMGPEVPVKVPDQIKALKPSSKFAVAVAKTEISEPQFDAAMSGSSSFTRQPPAPLRHAVAPVLPPPEVVAQVGMGGMASMVGMMGQMSSDPTPPNEFASCLGQLKDLGVTFQTTVPAGQTEACVVENPVQLAQFSKGNVTVEFPDKPSLNCKFAVRFVEWLSETGAPIALAQTHSPIAKLYTGPGFECRGRNGDTSAKISEHAKGNAVDIERVALSDGRVLVVKDAQTETSPAYATLKGLRGSACGYFTTVLGPGANAAHESHFHFDMAIRGKAGNYKICE